MMYKMCALLALLFVAPLSALADGTDPSPNTGFDPTMPLTSVAIDVNDTTLTANATQIDRTLNLGYALSHGQLTITLPYHDTLSIGGLGSESGAGDASIFYSDIFMRRSRFSQAAGLGLVIPSGNATFSAGQTQLVPTYALSYRLWKRLHLIATAQYAFPVSTRTGFAQTQNFSFAPGALVNLSRHGAYALIGGQWDRTTGDYRYDAYRGSFRIGDVIARHYNISAFIAAPLRSNFTYDNVFHVAYGAQLAIQR